MDQMMVDHLAEKTCWVQVTVDHLVVQTCWVLVMVRCWAVMICWVQVMAVESVGLKLKETHLVPK